MSRCNNTEHRTAFKLLQQTDSNTHFLKHLITVYIIYRGFILRLTNGGIIISYYL